MDELINRYRQSINPPYKFKDYVNLTLTFLLLLALPIAIFLAGRPQDIRQRAQEITPAHPVKPETPSVPDEILLKFKSGVPDKAKENIRSSHGIKVEEVIEQIDVERGKVPAEARDRIIEALKKNPQIEFAEPNYLAQQLATPNDPRYPDQWSLGKIAAPVAWDISKGGGVVIAVIDAGIKTDHEDLKDKLWINPGETSGNGVDDEGDGYIDDVNGWNFVDGNGDVSDATGHGTLVSGIAAANTNNTKGIASLSWDAKIMPLRVVTTSGGSSYFNMGKAIHFAVDKGAKSINISIGGDSASTLLQNAVNYAWERGVVIAAAAGNDAVCCIQYPAAVYDSVTGASPIAVGATAEDDQWNLSNIDDTNPNTPPKLDVMAPNNDLSTSLNPSFPYGGFSGTSASSPYVAGLVALIKSANSALTPQQITNIILQTTDKVGDMPYDDLVANSCNGWNNYYGCGRINAGKALQVATGITPSPPDTTTPTINITSPSSGSTVSGILDITANVTDNVGVVKVETYIDGVLLAADLISPYLASWDTTLVSNGSHTISAKAYDLAGNQSQLTSTTVNVSNTSPTATPIPTSPPPATPTPTSTTQTNVVTLSNIAAQTTANTATVNWTTNIPSSSRVVYAISSTNLNLSTVENATPVVTHTVTLTNLVSNTRYYYKVISRNSLGDELSSPMKNFKTKSR